MKPSFKELTKEEQTAILDAQQAEREAWGITKTLANAVRPATIKELSNGDFNASIRLAMNVDGKREFVTMFKYIKADQGSLKEFYENIGKGDLLSVEYAVKNGFYNINQAFKRQRKTKA